MLYLCRSARAVGAPAPSTFFAGPWARSRPFRRYVRTCVKDQQLFLEVDETPCMIVAVTMVQVHAHRACHIPAVAAPRVRRSYEPP